jgi:AraC-like DNA-binding protein
MTCFDAVPVSNVMPVSALPQHVRQAVAYLRAHLGEQITLAELSAACGIPERTLLKQFKRFLGISPFAYLHRLRLTTARAELLRSDTDVAIGYRRALWSYSSGEICLRIPKGFRRSAIRDARATSVTIQQ